MARRNETVVRGAGPVLDRFKYEVAGELGLLDKLQRVGWAQMTTREAGSVGGHMVRKLIVAAEESLAAEDAAGQRPEAPLTEGRRTGAAGP